MEKPNVLILGLNPLQWPLFDRLAAAGYRLFGTFHTSEYYRGVPYEEVKICDRRDIRSIRSFAEAIRPDAVISDQCDASHLVQAYLTEQMGLPGPRLAQAHIATNKWLQRKKAEEAGLLIPRYALARTVEEARRGAEEIGWPVMIKAVDNQGSWGVHTVAGPHDLPHAFYDSFAHSYSRMVLVEEFIAGREVMIDGYVWPDAGPQSLALATKEHLPDRPVAMDILYPGALDPALYERAMRMNEDVIRALGFRFGITHAEYMLTKDGKFYLIEAANRGGGSFISQLIVPAVSGIDIVEQYIADCLGQHGATKRAAPARHQVLLKFFEVPSGKIRSIEGQEAVRAHPSVLHFHMKVKPGDTVKRIEADSTRHVTFVLRGEGDLHQTAEQLFRQLHLTYEDL